MSEAELQKNVLRRCRDAGCSVVRINSGSNVRDGRYISNYIFYPPSGKPLRSGLPDLLVLFGSSHWFVELKTESGFLSPKQVEIDRYLENSFVVRDIEDVIVILNFLGV